MIAYTPCRACGAPLTRTVVDLGMSPLANSYVPPERAQAMEPTYPLHVFICDACRLVQLEAFEEPKAIFGSYLYFSSYSSSWLEHCAAYAAMMVERLGLTSRSKVVEIASNDGYLLQYFKARGVPVLGVEPAANIAEVARAKGIDTDVSFFGAQTAERLAAEGHAADLIAANNVLAHVPKLNDFIAGFKTLLKPEGVITIEVPHLLNMIAEGQFDTIYHEHFSYFSLSVVEAVLARAGLRVFDVDERATHGGSLRIYACHEGSDARRRSERVAQIKAREAAFGLEGFDVYARFAERVVETKCSILSFLIEARRAGKRVAAYGAPAKGNTLLNYCGVGPELIAFTVDANPHKQGHLLPGTRIPIRAPEAIAREKPHYIFILPWNLKAEIVEALTYARGWGAKFVVAVPSLTIF